MLFRSRDTNAPNITSVLNANATNLFIHFAEPVAAASALNLANYNLAGATVLGAELSADAHTVILHTTPLTFQNSYTLSVAGIVDRASAPNALVAVQVPFTAREFNANAVGNGSQAGVVNLVGSGANVTGGGNEIGGNADQFQFAWQSVTGNFD